MKKILFLLLIATNAFTQDSVEMNSTSLTLHSRTTLNIQLHSKLNANANLKLESDITGRGKLILNTNKLSYIDAKGHSISTLIIKTNKEIKLKSPLYIKEEIRIVKGKLILQEHDLVINKDAKINKYTIAHIEEGQEGRLIIVKQYRSNTLFSSLYQSNTKISPQILIQEIILSKHIISRTRGFPFYAVFYLEPTARIDIPPPKKFNNNKFNNNKKSIV